MDAIIASISINVVSNLIYDLAKSARGTGIAPLDAALARTVDTFPEVEGLKHTLRQWLLSPGVLDALEAYAKGLRGLEPIKINVLAATLIRNTQFFMPESTETTAQEIVFAFFSEIRAQYLMEPKLAMQHVANRIEEGISVSEAGFDALRSDVRELKDSLPSVAGGSVASFIDLQIDEGREHLRRHEHDLARQAWEKLRKNNWDRAERSPKIPDSFQSGHSKRTTGKTRRGRPTLHRSQGVSTQRCRRPGKRSARPLPSGRQHTFIRAGNPSQAAVSELKPSSHSLVERGATKPPAEGSRRCRPGPLVGRRRGPLGAGAAGGAGQRLRQGGSPGPRRQRH